MEQNKISEDDLNQMKVSGFFGIESLLINGVSFDGSAKLDVTSTINAMIDAKINQLDTTGV